MTHWHRLPREAVDAPFLEFKVRLSLTQSLIWCMTTLPMAECLELDDLRSPFHPKPFYDSRILKQSFPGYRKF